MRIFGPQWDENEERRRLRNELRSLYSLPNKIQDTFKNHVSCTDGKNSVRINLLFYLFFTIVPSVLDGTTVKNR